MGSVSQAVQCAASAQPAVLQVAPAKGLTSGSQTPSYIKTIGWQILKCHADSTLSSGGSPKTLFLALLVTSKGYMRFYLTPQETFKDLKTCFSLGLELRWAPGSYVGLFGEDLWYSIMCLHPDFRLKPVGWWCLWHRDALTFIPPGTPLHSLLPPGPWNSVVWHPHQQRIRERRGISDVWEDHELLLNEDT